MNRDVIQPLEPAIDHRWDASDRPWIEHTIRTIRSRPARSVIRCCRRAGRRAPMALRPLDRHNADSVLESVEDVRRLSGRRISRLLGAGSATQEIASARTSRQEPLIGFSRWISSNGCVWFGPCLSSAFQPRAAHDRTGRRRLQTPVRPPRHGMLVRADASRPRGKPPSGGLTNEAFPIAFAAPRPATLGREPFPPRSAGAIWRSSISRGTL